MAPAAAQLGAAGPLPADTVFVRAMRGEFDAVLAPYHDVGMTAIKVAAFGRAVNVTLGLPFPRTSPDHGTAFDIAGSGRADPSSMRAALVLAARLGRQAGFSSGLTATTLSDLTRRPSISATSNVWSPTVTRSPTRGRRPSNPNT